MPMNEQLLIIGLLFATIILFYGGVGVMTWWR
jgi:hypothetical protein